MNQEVTLEWHDQPALPAPLTPVQPAPLAPPEPAAPQTKGSGLKRTVLTAALSALLLVGGAAAVVSAASPDPGASSAPSTTTPGTTTPSTRPNHPAGGSSANCPNMGSERLGRIVRQLDGAEPRRDAGDVGPDVRPGGPLRRAAGVDGPADANRLHPPARPGRRRLWRRRRRRAGPRPRRSTDIGAGLQGPAGLAATTYATGLSHVSAFSFDAGGRLWAATAGYDDDGSDAVYLVASAGAAPTRVIADLHTPLGLVWDGDTLYVASEGRVDAYSRVRRRRRSRATARS